METKLEIQQILHGYSDGHRKLASSCRLPKDAERQILVLSDLSGPGGSDQFDSYLTGYPVESGDYYALARTWPAPEMGRPGCVWTHTLLIGTDVLAHLNHPEILLSLLRRPSLDAGFNGYLDAISLPSRVESEPGRDDEWGGELIRALYGGESPYTVLPVERYAIAEPPFLSIWRLQWPGLRQRFTFCTGVRSRRSLEGEVFYLQAALLRDVRRLDRGTAPLTVIERSSADRISEEWIRIALAAYVGLDNSLMDFFERVGYRLPGDTALFRPVVQTYSILNRGVSPGVVDELIHYTAEEYPEPDAGSDYKRVFFGENLGGLPEMELLRALSVTEKCASFDADVLGIRERAASLWSTEEQAWRLLVGLLTESRNRLGEEALLGLTSAMPASRLHEALASPPEVLAGIIRREPRLACTDFLWQDPAKHTVAAQALSACREQLAGQSDVVIRVALEAKADPTNTSLIDIFGPAAVAVVLNWLDEDRVREIPTGWRIALSSRSMEMLEWLVSHSPTHRETACFVLMTINLEAVATSPLLTEAIRGFMDKTDADDAAIIVAAKVLRLSLWSSAPDSVDLATIVFDVVYQAATVSRLPYDAWHGLLPVLPSSSWWQDWDRCERLRKGIAEKFRTEQWPARRLIGITKDNHVFAEIIDELRYRYSGRRVLAAAAESIDAGPRRALMLGE